jgi:hypothetical protein
MSETPSDEIRLGDLLLKELDHAVFSIEEKAPGCEENQAKVREEKQ